MAEFQEILAKYRTEALSQREKGGKFEALMQRYLLTDRKYPFNNVWLWGEFPYRQGFGGQDIGIDLVALDENNEYWVVQCKFYEETTPKQNLPTASGFPQAATGVSMPKRLCIIKRRPLHGLIHQI